MVSSAPSAVIQKIGLRERTHELPPLGGGGYGYRFADMARVFGDRGHDVQVITSAGGGEPPAGGGPAAFESTWIS